MMYYFHRNANAFFRQGGPSFSRVSMPLLPGLQIWDFESPEPNQKTLQTETMNSRLGGHFFVASISSMSCNVIHLLLF